MRGVARLPRRHACPRQGRERGGAAAWPSRRPPSRRPGRTPHEKLDELFVQHGCHLERQIGDHAARAPAGMDRMKEIMATLRATPPQSFGGPRRGPHPRPGEPHDLDARRQPDGVRGREERPGDLRPPEAPPAARFSAHHSRQEHATGMCAGTTGSAGASFGDTFPTLVCHARSRRCAASQQGNNRCPEKDHPGENGMERGGQVGHGTSRCLHDALHRISGSRQARTGAIISTDTMGRKTRRSVNSVVARGFLAGSPTKPSAKQGRHWCHQSRRSCTGPCAGAGRAVRLESAASHYTGRAARN